MHVGLLTGACRATEPTTQPARTPAAGTYDAARLWHPERAAHPGPRGRSAGSSARATRNSGKLRPATSCNQGLHEHGVDWRAGWQSWAAGMPNQGNPWRQPTPPPPFAHPHALHDAAVLRTALQPAHTSGTAPAHCLIQLLRAGSMGTLVLSPSVMSKSNSGCSTSDTCSAASRAVGRARWARLEVALPAASACPCHPSNMQCRG